MPIFDVALQHGQRRWKSGGFIFAWFRCSLVTTFPLPHHYLVDEVVHASCWWGSKYCMYTYYTYFTFNLVIYIHIYLCTYIYCEYMVYTSSPCNTWDSEKPPSQNLKRGFVDAVKDMSCLVYNPRSSLGTAEIREWHFETWRLICGNLKIKNGWCCLTYIFWEGR